MDLRTDGFVVGEGSFDMGEKGRLMIDLNACDTETEDLSHEELGPVPARTMGEAVQVGHYKRSNSELTKSQEASEQSNSFEVEDILETMNLVKKFHLRTAATGEMAEFCGMAGSGVDGQLVACECCGRPESKGMTLICDGCQRSFHVGCMKLRSKQAAEFNEWFCSSCVAKGFRQPWSLGRVESEEEVRGGWIKRDTGDATLISEKEQSSGTGTRLSSGGSQEDDGQRKLKEGPEINNDTDNHAVGAGFSGAEETRARGRPRVKLVSCLKEDDQTKETISLSAGKAQLLESESNGAYDDDEDENQPTDSPWQPAEGSGGTQKLLSTASGKRESPQSSLSFSSEDQVDDAETSSREVNLRKLEKQHMQKLKEFISQRHGILEDGWDVGVKKRISGDKVFDVTFYSPDGLKFRSRLEVARYLGLLEHKKGDSTFREYFAPSARSKRRKDFSRVKKPVYESEDDDESDGELQDAAKRRKHDMHISSYSQDLLHDYDLQLPLQCMDVKVESLGAFDVRPQYHDENHIWPVGYSCSWHDPVTESFCLSEVLDGGISGPVFRVTRKALSVLSNSKDIVNVQRLDGADQNYLVNGDHLHCSELEQKAQGCTEHHVHRNALLPGCGNCHVKSMEMKIPSERHSQCETISNAGSIQLYDDEDEDELQVLLRNFRNVLPDVMARDGDLSSMQVWDGTHLGKNSNNACDSIYGLGIEQIFRMESAIELEKNKKVTVSELKEEQNLAKNGKSPLEVIARDQEDVSQVFNEQRGKFSFFTDEIGEIVVAGRSSSEAWECLGQQFVERLCECHRQMKDFRLGSARSKSILSWASESNLKDLREGMGIRNIGVDEINFESLCAILKVWMGQDRFGFDIPAVQRLIKARKARLEAARPPPPCGRPIGNKVPAELVGDLLQIWEFLCRFSELLGQKEPPSLKDLEEGICDPWKTEMSIKSNTCKRDPTSKVEKSSDQVRDNLVATTGPGCIESTVLDCLEEQGVQNGKIESTSEPVSEQLRSKKSFKGSSLGAGCRSLVLASLHISLLKILVAELQQKLSSGPDLISETKRGKKKEGESGPTSKRQTDSFLTLNEVTWEEVARRYVVALSALNSSGENIDITFQERQNILHCLQGDGGVLCGGLDGVARIEVDSQLLAEAEKQVCGCLAKSDSKYSAETPEKESDDIKRVGDVSSKGGRERPSWARVLEPVRKLATNVGARIRNCVREALERDPPEWAKEILEWSISKEVYKGNASGPTKRAVLSVLDQLKGDEQELKLKKMKKIKYVIPTPVLVMNRCRMLLRQLIFSDEVRVFCNTLSGMVLGFYENVEDGTEITPPRVSRPLDFRIIDSRLAAGWYGESHELFAADIGQLWRNIPIVFREREDMIKIGEALSQQFEALYQKQVIELVSGREEVKEMSETSKNEDTQQLSGSDHELLKAPWEEGVCKICGIDKDDDNTLLCDGCDAEYHIYCLDPPLSKIPDGNWYCPSCIAHEMGPLDPAVGKDPNKVSKGLSRTVSTLKGGVHALAASMREREYWQLSVAERMLLLKFLCDKVLDSTLIREHVEQSIEALFEVQQKLRSLTIERQSQILKGSNTGSDNFTLEHTEAVNKDAPSTRKRGRKTTRGVNVSCTIEEIGRPGSGLEEIMMHGGDDSTEPSVLGKQGSGTEEYNSTRNRAGILASKVQDREVEEYETPFIPLHDYGTKKSSEILWNNNHGITSVVGESRSELIGDSHTSDNVLMGSGKAGWRIHEMHANTINHQLDRQHQVGIHLVDGQHQRGNQIQNVCYSHNNYFEEDGAFHVTEVQERKLQACFQGMKRDAEGSYAAFKGSSNPPMSCMESHVDLVENTSAEEIKYVETSQQCQPESGVGEQQGQTESLLQAGDAEQGASTVSNVRNLDMEIEKVEADLMKIAVRRECLGRDALDRVYWALGWEGKYPWLVIEGNNLSMAQGSETKSYGPMQHDSAAASELMPNMCRREKMEHIESKVLNSYAAWSIGGRARSGVRRWTAYESDAEFRQLLGWLRPSIQRERSLKSSIIRWQMSWSTWNFKNRLDIDKNFKQPTKGKAGVSSFPSTKATMLLVKKFGPFSRSEGLDEFRGKKRGRVRKVLAEEQLFRCECLEPVWPTRSHCQCCHETFESPTDLQTHNNGECFLIVSTVKEQASNLPASPKVKKRKSKIKTEKGRGGERNGVVTSRKRKTNGKGCHFVPPDFSIIVRNFSTTSSTREQILQIGCIADGGPTFAPALSFSPVFDPALIMNVNANNNLLSDITNLGLQLSTCPHPITGSTCFIKDGDQNTELTRANNTDMLEQYKTGGGTGKEAILASNGVLGNRLFQGRGNLSTLEKCQKEHSNNGMVVSLPAVGPVPPFQISAPEAALDGKNQDPEGRKTYLIEEERRLHNARVDQSTDGKSLFPSTALLPLSGRRLWILKKLKSNLLDMEAILADEALESPRGNPIQRHAWRCFLKSANSIYGLVLALIFFEQSLKGDFIRDSWCEWASPSALARTCTLSSLALRIYTFDAAIKYKKTILAFDTEDSEKQNKPGRKKKS